MRDLKFFARMIGAFIAIVLILGLAQKWDDAQDARIRVTWSARS
jgi:hypothetical protein